MESNADEKVEAATTPLPIEYAAKEFHPPRRLFHALAWNVVGFETGLVTDVALRVDPRVLAARWAPILLTMGALTLLNSAGFALAIISIRVRIGGKRQLFYALIAIAGFWCGLGVDRYRIAYSALIQPLAPELDNLCGGLAGFAAFSFGGCAMLLLIWHALAGGRYKAI